MNQLAPINENSLEEKDMKAVSDNIVGGFYSTNGDNKVPDSRLINFVFNKAKITTEFIREEQTNDYAKFIVRATSPDGSFSHEDTVLHHFETVMNKKLVEMYEKEKELYNKKKPFLEKNNKEYEPIFFSDYDNPFVLQSNGSIIPNLTQKGMMKIFKDMFQFKNFAIRDATTKARARAQKAVLNQDWREQFEIDSEMEEVTEVNNNKKVTYEPVETPKDKPKSFIEKALENEAEKAEEVKEEITVLFIAEDFEEVPENELASTVIKRTKDHLNATTGDSDNKAIRTIIMTHKDELNSIKLALADECMKLLNEGK